MSVFKSQGFHGTSYENANSILINGFNISFGDDEWLGDGVYFFIDGLADPQKAAGQWACVNAWDNSSYQNRYSEYAILGVTISTEESNVLDLREQRGCEVFEYVLQKMKSKLKRERKKRKIIYVDGLVINFARNYLFPELVVSVANVYIKLTKEARVHRINRVSQNCTICAVHSPKDIVTEVKIVEQGDIPI
ncbi:Uncharacterised protein [Chlamydia trachomatis]|nr:Uncharacterised protein [Chlamydia trachomatis]